MKPTATAGADFAHPEDALADAFARLAAGVADIRSPFHTPALATLALDGAPSLRTVVLRAFDAGTRRARIHTDRRSAKAAEIRQDGRVMLHAYDPGAKVQVRLAGHASLHLDDDLAEAAWATSRESSRMCYAAAEAPGTPVARPPEAPRDPFAGRGHFAAVSLAFTTLDWLLLDGTGHRRARFAWGPDGSLSAGWVAP